MKKISQIFSLLSIIFFSFNVQAQSKTGAEYFEGKWNVLVKGTPGGDAKLSVVLEKKDTAMTGSVLDSTGNLVSKLDKVEMTDSTATVYFIAEGYNVSLVMIKKDDDHITGNMLGMFDADGERVKTIK